MSYDVIVIGGGPAGMYAAVTAATIGNRVLLLEANDRLGKKLLITGKGRCNVTNNCAPQEVLQNVPRNGRFLYSAMENCPPSAVMDFFEIFLPRMILCRKAAEKLGMDFKLLVNGQELV